MLKFCACSAIFPSDLVPRSLTNSPTSAPIPRPSTATTARGVPRPKCRCRRHAKVRRHGEPPPLPLSISPSLVPLPHSPWPWLGRVSPASPLLFFFSPAPFSLDVASARCARNTPHWRHSAPTQHCYSVRPCAGAHPRGLGRLAPPLCAPLLRRCSTALQQRAQALWSWTLALPPSLGQARLWRPACVAS